MAAGKVRHPTFPHRADQPDLTDNYTDSSPGIYYLGTNWDHSHKTCPGNNAARAYDSAGPGDHSELRQLNGSLRFLIAGSLALFSLQCSLSR